MKDSSSIHVSRNEQYAYVQSTQEAKLYDLDKNCCLAEFNNTEENLHEQKFSDDSKHFYLQKSDRLLIYDIGNLTNCVIISLDNGLMVLNSFSPDGNYVIIIRGNKPVIVDIKNNKEVVLPNEYILFNKALGKWASNYSHSVFVHLPNGKNDIAILDVNFFFSSCNI